MKFTRANTTTIPIISASMITPELLRVTLSTGASKVGFLAIAGGQPQYTSTSGLPNGASLIPLGSNPI